MATQILWLENIEKFGEKQLVQTHPCQRMPCVTVCEIRVSLDKNTVVLKYNTQAGGKREHFIIICCPLTASPAC